MSQHCILPHSRELGLHADLALDLRHCCPRACLTTRTKAQAAVAACFVQAQAADRPLPRLQLHGVQVCPAAVAVAGGTASCTTRSPSCTALSHRVPPSAWVNPLRETLLSAPALTHRCVTVFQGTAGSPDLVCRRKRPAWMPSTSAWHQSGCPSATPSRKLLCSCPARASWAKPAWMTCSSALMCTTGTDAILPLPVLLCLLDLCVAGLLWHLEGADCSEARTAVSLAVSRSRLAAQSTDCCNACSYALLAGVLMHQGPDHPASRACDACHAAASQVAWEVHAGHWAPLPRWLTLH